MIAARLRAYEEIAPLVNSLMCYITFIGRWRDMTPPSVIELKRGLDSRFYVASPLFSEPVNATYDAFIELCFQQWNDWGQDALICSGAERRKQALGSTWSSEWDALFVQKDIGQLTSPEYLQGVRKAYNALLAALVSDIRLTAARDGYLTDRVPINAH